MATDSPEMSIEEAKLFFGVSMLCSGLVSFLLALWNIRVGRTPDHMVKWLWAEKEPIHFLIWMIFITLGSIGMSVLGSFLLIESIWNVDVVRFENPLMEFVLAFSGSAVGVQLCYHFVIFIFDRWKGD